MTLLSRIRNFLNRPVTVLDPPPGNLIVTVQKGDTLRKLALQHLGDPARWTEIYDLNQRAITEAQQASGRRNRKGPHWIYPGTILFMPRRDL